MRIIDDSICDISFEMNVNISRCLKELAIAFPNELIVWCHIDLIEFVNFSSIPEIFKYKQGLVSFSSTGKYLISSDIGFVDQSIFINVDRNVRFPTWMMSSDVGGIHAETLNCLPIKFVDKNFDYFLLSIAKLGMPKGLFCYSDPNLLVDNYNGSLSAIEESIDMLYRFVSQHYKWFWIYILFFFDLRKKNLSAIPSILKALTFRRRKSSLTSVISLKHNQVHFAPKIDVIIPTIGRKFFLKHVLEDLKLQTTLPERVIIIEQNENKSNTDLDYLYHDNWPFKIVHRLIKRTGACNARNLAISLVKSEWVFFCDDDIRFNQDLIENALNIGVTLKLNVLVASCQFMNEIQKSEFNHIHQTGIYSSGASFVKSEALGDINYRLALEHGYGEDFDFGMQLRKRGHDVIFCPTLKVNHLKAPIGGFRKPHTFMWDNEKIQPKPSPTVMFTILEYKTKQQRASYKVNYLLSLWWKSTPLNIMRYYILFEKQWARSIFWANKLDDDGKYRV